MRRDGGSQDHDGDPFESETSFEPVASALACCFAFASVLTDPSWARWVAAALADAVRTDGLPQDVETFAATLQRLADDLRADDDPVYGSAYGTVGRAAEIVTNALVRGHSPVACAYREPALDERVRTVLAALHRAP